ncbi:hypothetical protein AAEX37_00866 [Oligella sp. MSHR50489EDL]|uniref:M48 family metallopeptidase n=1 Tax=Oligella sp. MSHR50489EDL TaxID=3139409 RepID=UPI003D817C3D
MKTIQIDSIDIQIHQKAIKNLYIRVLPPAGQVVVSLPKRMSEQMAMEFIIQRLPWIKAQRQRFAHYQAAPELQYETGEYHYVWGKAYRLQVIERNGKHEIHHDETGLYMLVRPGTSIKNRALVMENYYKDTMQIALQQFYVPHWEAQMGIKAPLIDLRRMKSRWGSCRSDGKRICLNTELAKRPLESIEYVFVHEMVHLLEQSHNHRFQALMDHFLPDWRERKQRLNSPLS